MRKVILSFIFCTAIFVPKHSIAQIEDGSIAADFTFTDIKGASFNLYSYLDQGKYVAIDISATWCSPCWNYHNQKVMEQLYQLHDAPGDNKWKVVFFEGDPNTNSDDLNGTGTNTQGNWVAGTSYTIIDPPAGPVLNQFLDDYPIIGFPSLYLIRPDRRIFEVKLPRTVQTWEAVASNNPLSVKEKAENEDLLVYPNPSTDYIVVEFKQSGITTVEIHSVAGNKVFSSSISNPINNQEINVSAFPAGVYFVTVKTETGISIKKLLLY